MTLHANGQLVLSGKLIGTFDTIKYRSRRPDSDRGTVFWCAPELGYMPVKVERQRGSKVEWSMSIATLDRK